MWLARNGNGSLYLFGTDKLIVDEYLDPCGNKIPYYRVLEKDSKYSYGTLNKSLFPEVTFENSPVKVEILTLSQIEDKYQEGFDNGYRAAEDCYCNNKWRNSCNLLSK